MVEKLEATNKKHHKQSISRKLITKMAILITVLFGLSVIMAGFIQPILNKSHR